MIHLLIAMLTLAHASPLPLTSSQLIVVKTAEWSSVSGQMIRYERSPEGGPWLPAGSPVTVVVGRNGLGWGVGLHSGLTDVVQPGEPVKQEGDGKAPAGIFSLGTAFGYDANSVDANRYPYLQSTESLRCVDDVNSAYYNELVDINSLGLSSEESPPWSSDERMLRSDELYRIGVVVKHNMSPSVMGMGSCIFMHTWRSADRGTAGCTAMESTDISATAQWLEVSSEPLLVQLPTSIYDWVKTSWDLP